MFHGINMLLFRVSFLFLFFVLAIWGGYTFTSLPYCGYQWDDASHLGLGRSCSVPWRASTLIFLLFVRIISIESWQLSVNKTSSHVLLSFLGWWWWHDAGFPQPSLQSVGISYYESSNCCVCFDRRCKSPDCRVYWKKVWEVLKLFFFFFSSLQLFSIQRRWNFGVDKGEKTKCEWDFLSIHQILLLEKNKIALSLSFFLHRLHCFELSCLSFNDFEVSEFHDFRTDKPRSEAFNIPRDCQTPAFERPIRRNLRKLFNRRA